MIPFPISHWGTNPIVTRNAVNIYGIGNATGTALNTSTGAQVTYSNTFINQSGKAITIGSLCLSGWFLTTTGTANCGNNVPTTGTVEYPIGVTLNTMTLSGNSTISVPNGTDVVTDQITLTTPIPPGASFKVNLASTNTSGQMYLTNLGLSGVLTTTSTVGLAREMIFAVGDSIMTNNNGAVTTACTGRCPSMQLSIGGTTATTYGASNAANFVLQVALATRLGATRFISNFGTNDIAAGVTSPQLIVLLQNMQARANAVIIKFTQTTITPRTNRTIVNASAVTSSGNTMVVSVPDATQFIVGRAYLIAGANQSEYNTNCTCTAIDTGANTVSLFFIGSATSPATGTITISAPTWSSHELQTPVSAAYASGPSSVRGIFNAAVRLPTFDGYIDWGDACETVRDSGIWSVGGEKTELTPPQFCTVQTGFTAANRFQLNYTRGSTTTPNGFGLFESGANIGITLSSLGNNGGDYQASSNYPNVPSVGDTFYVYPGTCSPSDDGLHPRVAQGSFGGQMLIVDSTSAWLNTVL